MESKEKMRLNIRKSFGVIFLLVGVAFILNSLSGITGFVVADSIEKGLSSVLGMLFIVGGILVFISGRKQKEGDLVKVVRFFHGAVDKNQAENIRLWGPNSNKPFYITREKDTAENAAGPNGSVITFEIPGVEAQKYIDLERDYTGIYRDGGREIEVKGELAKNLKKYLSKEDRRFSY